MSNIPTIIPFEVIDFENLEIKSVQQAQITLETTFLRYILKAEAFKKNEDLATFNPGDYDTEQIVLKSKIDSILMFYHPEEECYGIQFLLSGGSEIEFHYIKRSLAESNFRKIEDWFLKQ